MPAALAAIKELADFLVKQDVTNKEAYAKAASGCYQFYNKSPFYDIVSYFDMLKEHVFKSNAEFEALHFGRNLQKTQIYRYTVLYCEGGG